VSSERPTKLCGLPTLGQRRLTICPLKTFVRPILKRVIRAPKAFDLTPHVRLSLAGRRVVVTIEHDIGGGWSVTTADRYLRPSQFHENVRSTLLRAEGELGRRLFFFDDVRDEVLAALSYHVDKRRKVPVVLTALGLRTDDASPDHRDCSRGAASVLLTYVHEIARQVGRPPHVDIYARDEGEIEALVALGFAQVPIQTRAVASGTRWRHTPPR
jgi:hypothetical protein